MQSMRVVTLAALLFVGLLAAPVLEHAAVDAQERVVALGKYDFQHYFEYEELTAFMRDMHEAYPHLTELGSLAESQMGREVWMMTINNPETGRAEDKPGIFIDQVHAGEVIAAASNCYTIWYLLENYGKDEEVTDLVDHNVFYMVPRLDVDGA